MLKVLSRGSSAFSLIEILAVLAIVAVLSVAAASTIGPALSAYRLTSSASLVFSELELARQKAITSQQRVLVRFFHADGAFRFAQSYRNQDGNWLPMTKLIRIPEGISFHTSPVFSSLLSSSHTGDPQVPPVPTVLGTTADEIREFEFLPNGASNLSSMTTWTLTIVNLPSTLPGDSLPPNFITIQIEPETGRLKQFQP